MDVLSARGSEFETEIAFGVARQLFEPMLRVASSSDRRRLLAGVARIGARALGVEGQEPLTDRFAAVHGLYWLCANRAEIGPLVVLVDDVQWGDDPSLAWIGYLARRVGDLPLALVLGLRSGDAGGERGESLRLVSDGGVERITLGPLSAAAVGVIVRCQLDAEAEETFCAVCRDLTGGNPLLLRELLGAAHELGLAARDENVAALRRIAPSAVGPSVLVRLERLGDEAVALARGVAVLGPGAEVMLAARLAGLDATIAELTADRLAAAQILAPLRPLEFFHPLIGEAVREDMAPGARRVAHRRAATLVDGEGSLARVAAHLLACGPAADGWVVRRLADAARHALESGAPDVAVDYLRRALAEPPAVDDRGALLFLLGTAEWRTGQPEAIGHLEQARAEAGQDCRTLIAACGALALAYVESDRAERAVQALEQARAAVGDREVTLALTERLGTIEPEPLRDARLASMLEASMVMVGLMNERTAPAALGRAEELRNRLTGVADPPVHLLVTLAYYATRTNRAAEAQELTERALACEPYPPPLEVSSVLIVTMTVLERYDALQRLCEDLLAAARRHGAIKATIAILVSRASASCDCGALADAEADVRWVLERTDAVHRVHALSELIRVLTERDMLDQAEDELERFGDPRPSRSDEVIRFLIAQGRLRSAQGRLQEALDDFLEAGQRCEPLGRRMLSTVPWRSEAALIHAAFGNAPEASRLAAEQLELARAFGLPRTLGISLRTAGLVEGGERGTELLRDAVRTLERSQSPLELARARTEYGSALRRAGRRVQARAELERALDLAHHCGARRIANRARAELAAAGAKPRRDAITGRDALTASELRVARLAAQGLTNRQIAQSLFITTRTAKVHLGRVYRKLGITRRGQLAVALTGLLDDGREGQTPSRKAIS
jgi:DNA-binding CsgD family transcriptional regulator/predicted negative regulator of RcsB-dependent stress response